MSETDKSPLVGILSISIRGFRGIDSLDLDFTDPQGEPNSLVVIAGPNGCGKTSVIEAALRCINNLDPRLQERELDYDRRGGKECRVQSEIKANDQVDSYWFSESYSSLRNGCPRPNIQRPVLYYGHIEYFSSKRTTGIIGALQVSVGKNDDYETKETSRLKRVKQHLVNAAVAEKFPGKNGSTRRYSDWINKINESWCRFYPDSKQTFRVELIEDGDRSGAFDVYLVDSDGTRLEIDFLSSGQLEVFVFIATLVFDDDRAGIVFIDEPELHLDPQWHRPLMSCLLNLKPKAQFIVATHSPEIFASARFDQRHFLVPKNDPRAKIWESTQSLSAMT